MQNTFLDYTSFLKANKELIDFLDRKISYIITRYSPIFDVLKALYEKATVDKKELNKDEEEIFEVGFSYLYDRFVTINLIKEHVFNNNLEEMERHSKSICLLLYVNDYIDEVDGLDGNHKKDHEKLADLEQKIMKKIESKELVTDLEFAMLNDLTDPIFEAANQDFYAVPEIFYDIAFDMDLIEEDDPDYVDVDDFI